MSIFSDSFRVVLWFLLCVGMAVGMIIFAIIYGVVAFSMKKIAWREFSFLIPNLKLAK